MADFGYVDLSSPLGPHYLNKYRRIWCKVIPGLYGGLTFQDLTYKQNMSISGMTDQTVSGWRRVNRLGQYGYLQFDGANDQAVAPTGISVQNNFTLSATFYNDTTSNKGCIIRVGDTQQGFGVGVGSGNYDTAGNDLVALVESIRWQTLQAAIGTGWHHIAVVMSSSGHITAYLDGAQVYTESSGLGPNASSSYSLFLGGYTATAGGSYPRYFRGGIDNACLYTKALSAADLVEDWRLVQSGFVNALNYVKRKPFLFLTANPPAPGTTPAGIGGDASWDVRSKVGATCPASWDARILVGSTYTYTWNINGPVGVAGSASWDVAEAPAPTTVVGIYGDASFDVLASVGSTCTSIWNVMARVGVTVDAAWDVADGSGTQPTPVGISGDAPWDIRQYTSMSGNATWNVSALIGAGGAASWDNRQPAGLEVSASWANMIPVGIAGGAGWDMRTPAGIVQDALWHVRGTVGGGFVDRWDDCVPVSLTRSADWAMRGLTGLAGTASWDVATLLARWPVGLVGSLVWADRRSLGFSGMVTWDDRLPRGLPRNVVFNIHINSGISSTVNFNTRVRLGTTWGATWADRLSERITRQDGWNVRALARLSAADSWRTRAASRLDRSVSWNMRKPVGMSLSGTWRDRARVATADACVWDQRARAGLTCYTSWDIRNTVILMNVSSWDLRAVTGLSDEVNFTTFRATQAGGIAYDPAAAAAYVEGQHGPNPWGVIPAAGSVRIDHDYPTPDAMRATRGLGTEGIPGVGIRIFTTDDYKSGRRRDPADVRGRSLTGHDGRWLVPVYLIPGDYCILYEESMRPPVLDYLAVVPTPGREPPPLPDGDINNPYYEMDYYLTIAHGWGAWGPGSGVPGPSPVDHDYGEPDQYTFTRNGSGLAGVVVTIYPQADYLAGRTGDRYRVGWSRTNAAGKWDWPVNLYPGLYTAQGWRDGAPITFKIEVT